jgi:uncharacterized protein (DUF2132 family)
MTTPAPRPNDPLHGVTLEKILQRLVEHHGWTELARWVPIRCFMFDPSISSSLKFLRRTPWARKKVEELYVASLPRED